MAYKALYRTYRPTLFKDVVGQKHIITILKNAVIKDRISHAYVFSGLRGIGKTTIARIFAKAVNCLNPENGEPCDKCNNCLSVINNETTDVVELDAASNNGVDQMRDILEKVNFLPSYLKKKVYIIDEAHMLSTAAFNALLKTLEEPPAHVIFILATTEPYKIPSTILSRCQRLDFKQLTTQEIKEMLSKVAEKEQININDTALLGIAEASEGGMRDALSILDQARVYNFNQITIDDINNITGRVSQENLIKIVQALNELDTQKALDNINKLMESGKEVARILTCLIQFCRDLLLYKSLKDETSITYMYQKEEFVMLAENTNEKRLFYYVDSLADVQNKIKYTNSQKIYLEVGIIKIISNATSDLNIGARIQQLEEKISLLNPTDGIDSLNGVFNRIDSIENKIKKLSSELEKSNYQGFKEEIMSKINTLEDVTLANKGIPLKIEEKIQDLEEKIIELNVHQNVNLDNNIQTEKIVQPSTILDDEKLNEINTKIALIENNLNDLTEYTNHLQPSIIAKVKEEFISNQPQEQPAKVVEENKDLDESVNERLNSVEEYLDMVIATVDELSKTIKQSDIVSHNFNSSDGEITQLNENYFVLLNLVKNLQDKVQNSSIAVNSPTNNETIELFKSEISDKINNIIEDIESKVTSCNEYTNQKINEVQASIEENINLINETKQELSTRLDNVEKNTDIEVPDYSIAINENTELINNIKEYSIGLSAKVQEIQNKVTEINTKLDGGITKRRSPFEVNREDEEDPVVVVTKKKQEDIKELPTKETKIIEEDDRKVISNSNTVVIKTKPTTNNVRPNDPNNVYDIKIVERILYQAHDQKCRAEKASLLANWSKLEDKVGHMLAPTAKLLSEGFLAANGFNELLIVYPHASMCNHLMESKGHMNALQVLKITFGREYDFIALPENTWQEKRSEYAGQFHMGITFPKLTPINNPELKVNVVNTSNLFSKKNTSMHQAQSFFGADMVEKEEE